MSNSTKKAAKIKATKTKKRRRQKCDEDKSEKVNITKAKVSFFRSVFVGADLLTKAERFFRNHVNNLVLVQIEEYNNLVLVQKTACDNLENVQNTRNDNLAFGFGNHLEFLALCGIIIRNPRYVKKEWI